MNCPQKKIDTWLYELSARYSSWYRVHTLHTERSPSSVNEILQNLSYYHGASRSKNQAELNTRFPQPNQNNLRHQDTKKGSTGYNLDVLPVTNTTPSKLQLSAR